MSVSAISSTAAHITLTPVADTKGTNTVPKPVSLPAATSNPPPISASPIAITASATNVFKGIHTAAGTATSASKMESAAKTSDAKKKESLEKAKIDKLIELSMQPEVQPKICRLIVGVNNDGKIKPTGQLDLEVVKYLSNKISGADLISIQPHMPKSWSIANPEISGTFEKGASISEEGAYIELLAILVFFGKELVWHNGNQKLYDAAALQKIKSLIHNDEISMIRKHISKIKGMDPNYVRDFIDCGRDTVKTREFFRETLFVADECLTPTEWASLKRFMDCNFGKKFKTGCCLKEHREIFKIIKRFWKGEYILNNNQDYPRELAATEFREALKYRIANGSLGFTRESVKSEVLQPKPGNSAANSN